MAGTSSHVVPANPDWLSLGLGTRLGEKVVDAADLFWFWLRIEQIREKVSRAAWPALAAASDVGRVAVTTCVRLIRGPGHQRRLGLCEQCFGIGVELIPD